MATVLTLTAAECRGVIFDMDGVVTDTARVHARAWKQMFDDYLGRRAARREGPFQAFDLVTDYRRYVDGKAREDGVRSFLASRGIRIEEGHPGDPSDRETVYGLGTRKNELFLEHVRVDHAARFEDAVDLDGCQRAPFFMLGVSAVGAPWPPPRGGRRFCCVVRGPVEARAERSSHERSRDALPRVGYSGARRGQLAGHLRTHRLEPVRGLLPAGAA
jgi:hypothetical protein